MCLRFCYTAEFLCKKLCPYRGQSSRTCERGMGPFLATIAPQEFLVPTQLSLPASPLSSAFAMMERTSFRKKSRIRPMRPVGPMVTCCEEGRPHILLQTRTKVLNNDLEEVFRRWYPLFRVQAQAA